MGQALFFNMTNQPAGLSVNQHPGETIAALPTTSPYTPNHNATTYNRVNEPPRTNEFGPDNTVYYELEGGTAGTVNVTINVNMNDYPISEDLLIYMFLDAVVILAAIDAKPYMGKDGSTIQMGTAAASTF
jgi:hypothetical protein